MSIEIPSTIGGAISVADSDELATLPLDGLTVGTKVWNADVGADFKLTKMGRTEIAIETTDTYDDPTWTLANATFTGFEGCTLVMVLTAPNASFSRTYVIDTVGGADNVDVLDPPAGATTGELFGSAVLYDDALVTDSVVDANGVTGLRWVKDTSGSNVQTVTAETANAVDNADPQNPVIQDASITNAGTMSAADKIILDNLYLVDPWYSQQAAFLKSKVSALTQFAAQKLGQYNLGSILAATGFANAGNMVGGSIQAAGASYTTLGGPIYQDIRNAFGFAFRGIIAVTITGKAATLGLINTGATNLVGVQSAFDTSATKYILVCQALTASIGTISNDGLEHTFAVTGPAGGGAIKLWIDGVDSGASITQASAAAEPLAGVIQNTTAGNAQASKFLYGWV